MTFSQKFELTIHELVHENEKPYSSDLSKQYKIYKPLKQMEIHSSGLDPKLTKKNPNCSALTRHKNTHTTPIPFVDCGVTIKSEDIKEEINEEESVEDPLSIDHESVNNNEYDMIDIEKFKLEKVAYVEE